MNRKATEGRFETVSTIITSIHVGNLLPWPVSVFAINRIRPATQLQLSIPSQAFTTIMLSQRSARTQIIFATIVRIRKVAIMWTRERLFDFALCYHVLIVVVVVIRVVIAFVAVELFSRKVKA
jgi:hypothetical protein